MCKLLIEAQTKQDRGVLGGFRWISKYLTVDHGKYYTSRQNGCCGCLCDAPRSLSPVPWHGEQCVCGCVVLQQSSPLLTLILPFPLPLSNPLSSPAADKEQCVAAFALCSSGDEKSFAVALCWPVLLGASRPAGSTGHFYMCVGVCVCVCVCLSVCFTSSCFVKWFVLTVLPRPATMVTPRSLVPYTLTHTHTHTHIYTHIYTHIHTAPMQDYAHHR